MLRRLHTAGVGPGGLMSDDVLDPIPTESGVTGDAELRTFLIADDRGYTSFTQLHGDEKAAKLAAKFAQVSREVVQAHQGSVLELRGDEALCVFVSPRQAVRAAIALQRRFVEATRFEAERPRRVGSGIEFGEAVAAERGYRSDVPNLAARLCSIAKPGEILASADLSHVARRLDGMSYVVKEPVRLKGMTDPVRPVRVLPEGEDPSLQLAALGALPPKVGPRGGPSWLPPWLRGGQRLPVLVGVVILTLVAAGVVVVTTRGGDGGTSLTALGATSAGVLDAASGRLIGHTQVGSSPAAVVTTKDAVWVANTEDDSVSRIDIATGRVNQTTDVGSSPTALAAGAGSIWVANSGSGTVSRVDPASGRIRQTLQVGSGPSGLAFDHGTLWVVDTTGGGLFRLDTGAGADVAELVARVGVGPTSVAARGDQLWVSSSGSGTVVQVDPRSGDVVQTVHVGNDPRGIALVGDSLWVTNNLDGTLSRVSLATGATETTRVGAGPVAVAGSQDAIWVADNDGRTLTRIDPRTNHVVSAAPTSGAPTALALAGDRLWLATASNPALHRGGTLTASGEFQVELDPARGYENVSEPIDAMLYDGLVGLRRTGGATGGTVVPDLAVGLPAVSTDGRTYTFQLRHDIRWSTGDLVVGPDIRRGLERNVAAGIWNLYDGIVGAHDCTKKKCDLSSGVEATATSNVVRIHLGALDPEFLYKLALPGAAAAPADTPLGALGKSVLPSTGPYVVQSHTKEKLELVRNSRFRVWSPAAQPAGFADRMVFTVTPKTKPGEKWAPPAVDWLTTFGVPDPEGVKARYGDRFVPVASPAVHYLFLNATGPPSDAPKARQAVALAIDRQAVQADWPFPGEVACQILPSSIPGYAPYCPYTLRPDDSGAWHGPDLIRAQRLVRESGTRGAHVIVVAPRGHTGMNHIADAMTSIGYVAPLRFLPEESYFPAITDPTINAQAGFTGWGADFPAASNFFQQQLSCASRDGGGNYGRCCDPAFDRDMAAAARLQVTSPEAALSRWAQIDREATDAAPLVPLVAPTRVDLVSTRLGHDERNIILGPLYAQAWVR